MVSIIIGEHVLRVYLVKNTSTTALLDMLENGPLMIKMQDYAGMEKVGSLPEKLPTNDVSTRVDAGDLILYQGRQLVLYYDKNSWSFTRLGKILDVSKGELKKILGTGDVEIVLSITQD